MNLFKDIKNFAQDKLGSSGPEEDWYITAERAEGVKDKDFWSKSDSYVVIDFGGRNVKTHAINNDRTPFWNETFHFHINSDKAGDIKIKLMDDDVLFDDSIGSATISKEDLPTYSGEEKFIKIPVLRKEQMTGLVHLRIKKVGGVSQSQGVSSSSAYSEQYPSNYSSQQEQSSMYSSQQPNQNQNQNQPQQPMNYSSSTYQTQPQSQYSSNYQGQGQGLVPPMVNINQPPQQQQQQPYSSNLQQSGYYNNPPNANYDQYQQKRY